jgi:Eco57I restriction-modification methylase
VTFGHTKQRVLRLLTTWGFSSAESMLLADAWLVNGDFLLEPLAGQFDVVVGNPPYVRQEVISAPLLAEYRRRYATLFDRADLYVPFIERSLSLLARQGVLGFICSDRWMKNRYGGPLRAMVASGFRLKYYVDMVGTAAFQSEVIAYPAITVVQRGEVGSLRLAHRPDITAKALSQLHGIITGPRTGFNGTVMEVPCVPNGSDPWLLEADAQPSLALVRRLESALPSLADAGCAVGIGVATGADKIFIGPLAELEVEDERKLPLVTTRDLCGGKVQWRGLGVVNPFEDDGSLADFARYPRFAAYMEKHAAVLKARHCAQRANGSWYRTIDRITPSLARTPKLLIPDIKGAAHIALEDEGLYPQHNLYFIVSKEWPLAALQAVLMAGIAQLFVRAYSTKMHGGALRFQAQYLRRIRLPLWASVSLNDRQQLLAAIAAADKNSIQVITARLFGLTSDELQHLSPDSP